MFGFSFYIYRFTWVCAAAVAKQDRNLAEDLKEDVKKMKGRFFVSALCLLFTSSSFSTIPSTPLRPNMNSPFSDTTTSTQEKDPEQLKVLFLSSDTGGGHRASAEALANQFLIQRPGTAYDLLDIWTTDGCLPYRTLVGSYKHLSSHPKQWKFLYHLSNTYPYMVLMNMHSRFSCERKIRRRLLSYNPDVIVSVHPTMTCVPQVSVRKILKTTGKYIPNFTVVTDLGSAHATWFTRHCDKIFVASDRIRRLARLRGWIPNDRIVMSGLPIRSAFAKQMEKMGGSKTTKKARDYILEIRKTLGIINGDDPATKVVLVMGGGEGVGKLTEIVDKLYSKLKASKTKATICVVWGRNKSLKKELTTRDWVLEPPPRRLRKRARLKRKLKKGAAYLVGSEFATPPNHESNASDKAEVHVVGLGFLRNMDEWMVASDVLVSKAGPGTIAEAAAVGLPIMLTSFLPGQEAGNVDVVLSNGFGGYNRKPHQIADIVSGWLENEEMMRVMSRNAANNGRPDAAKQIVEEIIDIAEKWKDINDVVLWRDRTGTRD